MGHCTDWYRDANSIAPMATVTGFVRGRVTVLFQTGIWRKDSRRTSNLPCWRNAALLIRSTRPRTRLISPYRSRRLITRELRSKRTPWPSFGNVSRKMKQVTLLLFAAIVAVAAAQARNGLFSKDARDKNMFQSLFLVEGDSRSDIWLRWLWFGCSVIPNFQTSGSQWNKQKSVSL